MTYKWSNYRSSFNRHKSLPQKCVYMYIFFSLGRSFPHLIWYCWVITAWGQSNQTRQSSLLHANGNDTTSRTQTPTAMTYLKHLNQFVLFIWMYYNMSAIPFDISGLEVDVFVYRSGPNTENIVFFSVRYCQYQMRLGIIFIRGFQQCPER